MGDHRAELKVWFRFHDKVYKHHYAWINWCPDSDDGIDSRVRRFFEHAYQDGMARDQREVEKWHEEQRKEEIEAGERAELARLKAKYDP
jgi:hypothetical protein